MDNFEGPFEKFDIHCNVTAEPRLVDWLCTGQKYV